MDTGVKIVILGAGFSGLRAAKILARSFPGQVTLIDKNDYHLFTPELYELNEKRVKLPFKTKAKFVQKKVADYHELDYDYLVLATGSQVNYYGIPGLRENALTFKGLEDIEKLRQIPAGEILIIGGGATGVELAAHLAQKLQGERIKIIDACPQILPNLDDDLRKKAQKRLDKLEVEVFCSRCLIKVDSDEVFFENGECLKYNNLIWTGGVSNGQYKVDEYLRIAGENNVFAVGDCSSADPGLIRPALEQAEIAAENIIRMAGARPLIAYKKRFWGVIVPLGSYYALGKIGRINLSGPLPWLIKKIINFLYKRSL